MANAGHVNKKTVLKTTIAIVVLVSIPLFHVAFTTQMWREFAASIFDLVVTAVLVYFFTTDKI